MNSDDVRAVLRMLLAAFPGAPITDDTPIVWRDALANVDRDAGIEAARSWTLNETRFPAVAAFLDACDTFRPALPELGPGPAVDVAVVPKERVSELLSSLRLRDLGDHDHRNGWKSCPVCVAAKEAAIDEPDDASPAVATGACAGGCSDTGFVTDLRTLEVRPCYVCRPRQRELYDRGCFRPEHRGCESCRPRAARRRRP